MAGDVLAEDVWAGNHFGRSLFSEGVAAGGRGLLPWLGIKGGRQRTAWG